MKKTISTLFQTIILVSIVVIARLLPHPPNFTPIAAVALFSGAYLTKKQSLVIPIIAMMLSDLFIGFDSLPMRIAVYGSILIGVFIGYCISKNKSIGSVVAASFASSLIFFIITNFGVWAFGTMYTKSLSGLLDCFILAIPFFKNTLLGDLFYSGLFFGSYEFVRSVPKLKILNFKL